VKRKKLTCLTEHLQLEEEGRARGIAYLGNGGMSPVRQKFQGMRVINNGRKIFFFGENNTE